MTGNGKSPNLFSSRRYLYIFIHGSFFSIVIFLILLRVQNSQTTNQPPFWDGAKKKPSSFMRFQVPTSLPQLGFLLAGFLVAINNTVDGRNPKQPPGKVKSS